MPNSTDPVIKMHHLDNSSELLFHNPPASELGYEELEQKFDQIITVREKFQGKKPSIESD